MSVVSPLFASAVEMVGEASMSVWEACETLWKEADMDNVLINSHMSRECNQAAKQRECVIFRTFKSNISWYKMKCGNVGGGRSGEAEKRDIQYGDDKNVFKWSHLKSNLWFLN